MSETLETDTEPTGAPAKRTKSPGFLSDPDDVVHERVYFRASGTRCGLYIAPDRLKLTTRKVVTCMACASARNGP